MKLYCKRADQFTGKECNTVSALLKESIVSPSEGDSEEDLPMAKPQNKKRKIDKTGLSMCSDFILSSDTEVSVFAM